MAEAVSSNAKTNDSDDGIIRFEHKFFGSFDDLYFRLTDTGEAVAVLKLAANEAILGFDGIKREFMLKPDSADAKMLEKVAEGLQFVRGLRPGESLPKEVTTREASWDPTERHRRIARQRLTMQLVTWLTGNEHIFTSSEELMQVADDPQVKKNINLAFAEAAEELGLGRERREEVVQYIESLAKELAYIECERDFFAEICKIDEKVQTLRRIYSADRSMIDTTDQVARLSQRALKVFRDYFEQVDAQTGEILSMLKNIDNQIDYIRTVRDEVHRRQLPWEDFVPIWKSLYAVRSDENTNRIRDLYQFLAPRFMQVNEWVLVTKRGFETGGKKKPIGGTMRW
jgi:plasmid stabilization system protein ParE